MIRTAKNAELIIVLSLFGVALLVSGCGLESDKPLSALGTAARDTRLEGLWCADDGKERAYFYISYGAGAEGSLFLFGSDEKEAGMIASNFFVTRTARHTYLNLRTKVEWTNGRAKLIPDKTYNFMEYHFDWRNRLILSIVGGETFQKAVKEGKLHGKADSLTTTISHEPMGRLLEFIENAKPEQVFTQVWTAKKIGKR